MQVLAVCDVWRDRRDNACKKVNDHYAEAYGKAGYQPCRAYTDFREVLDRADIDAVLIATPAHWHATMAAMAAAQDFFPGIFRKYLLTTSRKRFMKEYSL